MQAVPYLSVLAIVLMLDFIVLEGKGTIIAIRATKALVSTVVSTATAPLR